MAPERLDAFADFSRDDVPPEPRRRKGYLWMTTGVDRTSGVVAVTSNWETAEDRELADPSFASVLQGADEFGLRPIRIDLYEQAGLELPQPLTTGPYLCSHFPPRQRPPPIAILRPLTVAT